ncbi:SH3 domain-containing protein [Streptomyces sp. URMC 123]|uniref:SH3 domain-containing protein n=1 Tax=Streptomyces sp. URMC 123 TaxID=3423403 RepID=UPI003F529375
MDATTIQDEGAAGAVGTANGGEPATAVAATPVVTTLAAQAGRATYPVAPGQRVKVRRTPSTSGQVVRVLPYDARVPVRCQRRGEQVSGPYGTTDIWDSIAPGEYVSDAYVRTGSDGFVAPHCEG